MKVAIVALALGVATGYWWGYGEGSRGQDSVAIRMLDHFGVAKVRDAEAARAKRLDDASRP